MHARKVYTYYAYACFSLPLHANISVSCGTSVLRCIYCDLHRVPRHRRDVSARLRKLIARFSLVISATPAPPTPSRPCSPSPCGINAYCRERFNTAVCECIPNYRGNPYQGCQPECLVNTDCPQSQACIRTKCQDPCPGTCGVGAICTVSNHVPICSCPLPTIGDAFTLCQIPVEGNSVVHMPRYLVI